MMDDQGTHMQLGGLDLQELEAQRAELVPDRVVMRRKKRHWRRRRPPAECNPFVTACIG